MFDCLNFQRSLEVLTESTNSSLFGKIFLSLSYFYTGNLVGSTVILSDLQEAPAKVQLVWLAFYNIMVKLVYCVSLLESYLTRAFAHETLGVITLNQRIQKVAEGLDLAQPEKIELAFSESFYSSYLTRAFAHEMLRVVCIAVTVFSGWVQVQLKGIECADSDFFFPSYLTRDFVTFEMFGVINFVVSQPNNKTAGALSLLLIPVQVLLPNAAIGKAVGPSVDTSV